MSGSSSVYGGHGPAGDVSFNYTPLVDVTFNLIIYFVLTSQISTANDARVFLPKPNVFAGETSAKIREGQQGYTVISVLSKSIKTKDEDPAEIAKASEAERYEIDGVPVPISDNAAGQLENKIKEKRKSLKEAGLLKKPEDFFVEVRADKRVQYRYVMPVIMAAAAAEVKKFNITAISDQ
jgi:biopolymer transport protein ExbD